MGGYIRDINVLVCPQLRSLAQWLYINSLGNYQICHSYSYNTGVHVNLGDYGRHFNLHSDTVRVDDKCRHPAIGRHTAV